MEGGQKQPQRSKWRARSIISVRVLQNDPTRIYWHHYFNMFLNLQTFTIDARLIGDNGRMLRMGLREAKQPFYLARMMVSDEVKSRTKLMQVRLSYGVKETRTLAPSSVVLFSKTRSRGERGIYTKWRLSILRLHVAEPFLTLFHPHTKGR